MYRRGVADRWRLSMSISIKLDTREFEALLNSAAAQIPKAMRAVVTRTARDARRTALGCVDSYLNQRMMAARATTAR